VKNHLKTPESQKACSLKATASFERHALVIKGNLIIDQNLKAGLFNKFFSTSGDGLTKNVVPQTHLPGLTSAG